MLSWGVTSDAVFGSVIGSSGRRPRPEARPPPPPRDDDAQADGGRDHETRAMLGEDRAPAIGDDERRADDEACDRAQPRSPRPGGDEGENGAGDEQDRHHPPPPP